MSEFRFEEKILYKCRQHWIIPLVQSLKYFVGIIIPITICLWFLTNYSFAITLLGFFIFSFLILGYEHYLWHHSWLLIGNQKVTLSVRNGIFSQYAMNIRYRNIRDSAVSKNSLLGFMLKYGTLFIRSTNAEGDFIAKYVPKVGKVYALINALSRYTDDERTNIDSIEKLHSYHMKKEFTHISGSAVIMNKEEAISAVKLIPGVLEVIELSEESRAYIQSHEDPANHGVHEVLQRKNIICLIHGDDFRPPLAPLVEKDSRGKPVFPGIPFPEIQGNHVVSGSPGLPIHTHLRQFFPYISENDASVLVGWDS